MLLNSKKFKMIDEDFVCENCQKKVSHLGYSARNHCPYCLHSKHVDINPGDRMSSCFGLLKPIDLEIKNGQKKIIFKCLKCGEIKKNIVANDDDINEIIKISTHSF